MLPIKPPLARNRRLAGEGVSIQAFGLRRKLLEVARWVRRARQRLLKGAGIPLDGELGMPGDAPRSTTFSTPPHAPGRHDASPGVLPDPPQMFSDGIPCAISV